MFENSCNIFKTHMCTYELGIYMCNRVMFFVVVMGPFCCCPFGSVNVCKVGKTELA